MGLLREGRDGDVTQVERIEDRNAQRRNARVECGEKVVDDEPDVIIQSFVFRLQVGTFFFVWRWTSGHKDNTSSIWNVVGTRIFSYKIINYRLRDAEQPRRMSTARNK